MSCTGTGRMIGLKCNEDKVDGFTAGALPENSYVRMRCILCSDAKIQRTHFMFLSQVFLCQRVYSLHAFMRR